MNFETKKVFVNKLDASLSSLKECQCVRAGPHACC